MEARGMSDWHLAELNIAHLQDDLESELLTDFVANLDRINSLAEQSPGFIWRLIDNDQPTETNFDFGDDYIATLSVWNSVESLHDFVYRTVHKDIMRRKPEWFHRMPRAHMVLWWVPEGKLPSVAEAKEKLDYLQDNGPTDQAFTFRQAFAKPEQLSSHL